MGLGHPRRWGYLHVAADDRRLDPPHSSDRRAAQQDGVLDLAVVDGAVLRNCGKRANIGAGYLASRSDHHRADDPRAADLGAAFDAYPADDLAPRIHRAVTPRLGGLEHHAVDL